MRLGPYSIRHDNLVVVHIRLWSAQQRDKSGTDYRIIRIGLQRDDQVSWLATWDQREGGLAGNSSHLLSGQGDLNYPLQVDDVIVAEEWETGAPAETLRGLVAEVQLSRVGELSAEVAEERLGAAGGREILRPLVSSPDPANRDLTLISQQLNESGLPDLSLPVYFYD